MALDNSKEKEHGIDIWSQKPQESCLEAYVTETWWESIRFELEIKKGVDTCALPLHTIYYLFLLISQWMLSEKCCEEDVSIQLVCIPHGCQWSSDTAGSITRYFSHETRYVRIWVQSRASKQHRLLSMYVGGRLTEATSVTYCIHEISTHMCHQYSLSSTQLIMRPNYFIAVIKAAFVFVVLSHFLHLRASQILAKLQNYAKLHVELPVYTVMYA